MQSFGGALCLTMEVPLKKHITCTYPPSFYWLSWLVYN